MRFFFQWVLELYFPFFYSTVYSFAIKVFHPFTRRQGFGIVEFHIEFGFGTFLTQVVCACAGSCKRWRSNTSFLSNTDIKLQLVVLLLKFLQKPILKRDFDVKNNVSCRVRNLRGDQIKNSPVVQENGSYFASLPNCHFPREVSVPLCTQLQACGHLCVIPALLIYKALNRFKNNSRNILSKYIRRGSFYKAVNVLHYVMYKHELHMYIVTQKEGIMGCLMLSFVCITIIPRTVAMFTCPMDFALIQLLTALTLSTQNTILGTSC